MDLGFVVAGRNNYTAFIYSEVNGGALKSLFNKTYSGSVAANSTLTFDAEGSSLILSLNGKIIGQATDKALATTAGSVGTWTSSGAVMSNFVGAPATGGAVPALATVSDTSNAKKAVSVTIKKSKPGHRVGAVRPLRGQFGQAHRAELGSQSDHGHPRQREDVEPRRHHHSE